MRQAMFLQILGKIDAQGPLRGRPYRDPMMQCSDTRAIHIDHFTSTLQAFHNLFLLIDGTDVILPPTSDLRQLFSI